MGWQAGGKGWRGGSVAVRKLVGTMVLLSLLGLFSAHAHAGLDEKVVEKFVGKNWVNGRSWELLDYSGRLGFVCGLFDGITLYYAMADTGIKAKHGALDSIYSSMGIPSNLTVGDVVKGMDEFYRDSANVQLPAICAYLHFVYQSRGDSQQSIDKRVFLWRKMFKE